ncbi:MAG: glucosamine-6-phosphate synthase, partial [Ilumatobacteraceae bacterium]
MCGIIAIVSRPSARPVPSAGELIELLDQAVASATLSDAAERLVVVDRLLKGVPGVQALTGQLELVAGITARLDQLDGRVAAREAELEHDGLHGDVLETANAELIAVRDAMWAIRRDRLSTAAAVAALSGVDAGQAAVAGYLAVHQALSSIDRMEVRGRDSAGIHLFVWDHGLDEDDPAVAALISGRDHDPLFQSGSVRWSATCLGFVYKAAAEIGELGDNVRVLRAAVHHDVLLRMALSGPRARVAVLGHTRWASVGIISEANCHPLNSDEHAVGADGAVADGAVADGAVAAGATGYSVAVLNGDV